jgi:uncharacterized protein (DUF427 family)
MQATLDGRVIAASDDIAECHGCQHLARVAVPVGWRQKAPKAESDLECPRGVSLYDVVTDGARRERAAWSCEVPRPAVRQVAGRIGFWKDVQVG